MASGAYIFAPLGTTLTASEASFFSDANPFGFIVFARNLETPDQIRRLTGDLRASVGADVPIFIDQEGGRVQRLRAPHWREWLPALDDATLMGDMADASLAIRYAMIATELRAIGIDGNCAPLGDIASAQTHPILRNRCYGSGPGRVTSLARAVATALLEGGVLPVLKHIPGQGRANLDAHLELPRVDTPAETLRKTDFAVFQGLSDLPLGMTSHIVYSDLDDAPATQSKSIINLIRNDIGFGGLLMTDDISMEALDGTPLTRGRLALTAGCDLVLHCNGDIGEMKSIASLGALTPSGQARADAALAQRRPAKVVDIEALAEDFAALHRRVS